MTTIKNKIQKREILKSYYTPDHSKKLIRECNIPYNDQDKIKYDYREVSLLKQNEFSFRGITFSYSEYMNKIIFNPNPDYPYSVLNNNSNIYISKARLKYSLPRFSFKSSERSIQTKPFYQHEYINYIRYMDIYLDFDIDNYKDIPYLIHDINYFIELLSEYKLMFEVVFSGNRGFKILLYNNYYTLEGVSKLIFDLTLNKYVKDHIKYLDHTCTYSIPSKLMKMNFTLCHSNETLNYVFPLKKQNYKNVFSRILKDNNFTIFNYTNESINNLCRDINYTSFFNDEFTYSDRRLIKFVKDLNIKII